MKIIQLVPALTYGDAVGNDVVALSHLISSMGYETKIYAQGIGPRIKEGIADIYTRMPELYPEDILIYHMASGSEVMQHIIEKQHCIKVMVYHNITPPAFFEPYDANAFMATQDGLNELKQMSQLFDYCLADSAFNKHDLINMGYTCPIAVLPILIPFDDYKQECDNEILNKYRNDGWINFLFVGRIAPNKKQEDVIKAFAYYKRRVNSNSRLFIVGNYQGMEKYYNKLMDYVQTLNVPDVIFTGHTSFQKILAYYSIAHVFLCMSEHEGFCVPLLEAMVFGVPVIAYDSCAVPETLGNSGVIIEEKNSVVVAMLVDRIIKDKALKEQIIADQNRRLEHFSYTNVSKQAKRELQNIMHHMTSNSLSGEDNALQRSKIIGDILRDIEIQITDAGVYDQSIPFSLSGDQSNSYGYMPKKHLTKQYLRVALKYCYHQIARVNPEFANKIKNKVFEYKHVMRSKRTPQILNKGTSIREDRIIINPSNEQRNPSILVDLTVTTRFDLGTGIQRVVNNIFNNIRARKIAVRNWHGQLITSHKYIEHKEGKTFSGCEDEICFLPGDKLLLLDSSWDFYYDFSRILKKAGVNNVPTYSVVYDMIPIQYPELVVNKTFKENFTSWQNLLLEKSDNILCISKTTADVVADYYKEKGIKRCRPLSVYYFHMGFDITHSSLKAREEIAQFVNKTATFLMVGTVEPRKGYMIVLEAFKMLLKTTCNIQLLIIGKNGWNNDDFINSMNEDVASHIMWVQDASDEELHWAYKNAVALIAASKDEGFGLPLIEAAHFGLPIICSDIPIFREVTHGYATYFDVMGVEALAYTIRKWLIEEEHPDSKDIKLYTWDESAQEILDIMDGKVEPYKIL